ncbi:hypothetical protein TMatcc_007591 [Talaromyces marneffei ATCC 18224]
MTVSTTTTKTVARKAGALGPDMPAASATPTAPRNPAQKSIAWYENGNTQDGNNDEKWFKSKLRFHEEIKAQIDENKIYSVRKEVAGICNQDDETTLNLRQPANMRVLEKQSRPNSDADTDKHTTKEDQQEKPNSFKKIEHGKFCRVIFGVFLGSLEQDNSDSVV